jgi:hypothetical protein
MVLGQDASNEMKIDVIGATMGEQVGPTRPGNLAAWAMPVWLSWLPCCISFALKSCSMEKLVPPKFQVIWTPFGSLKVKNIEKEVLWLSQVIPIKLGNM